MALIRRARGATPAAPEPAAPAPEVRTGPRKRLVVPIKPIVIERISRDPEKNEDGTNYVETIARYKEKVKNPLTAIRAKCVECSGGSLKEVSTCRVASCPLYPFRMGVNPLHKKARDRMARENDSEGDEA